MSNETWIPVDLATIHYEEGMLTLWLQMVSAAFNLSALSLI